MFEVGHKRINALSHDNQRTIMNTTERFSPKNARFYENDWLTIVATLVVFLFHCARFFNGEDWHVKNPVESTSLSIAVVIISQWIMPLFFFLSGMSSGYSLKSRGSLRYLSDRTKKLMVPFLFSVFVVSIPLQVWVERLTHGDFSGSFIAFYPHYFDGFYAFGGNFAWMGLHLWYLLVLFLFTVITLPIFRVFNLRVVQKVFSKAGSFCSPGLLAFVFVLPLFFVEYMVNQDPEGIGMRSLGGWSPVSYLCVFIVGYITTCSNEYRESFKNAGFVAFVLGLMTVALIILDYAQVINVELGQKYLVRVLVRSANSWFWIIAIYGIGCRFLSFKNNMLARLREIALPFYIIHQTIIVLFGFFLMSWDVPISIKYSALAAGSFCTILLLITGIGRINILRPLFGMRWGSPANGKDSRK